MGELLAVYANAGLGVAASICFLLGLVFGSFSSVLAYRLPRGQSVVAPRSCCPHCRHVLGPVDLVPVLSYIWLRGRCRHCAAAISWRYLVVELACGSLALGAALVGGFAGGLASVAAWTLGHVLYGLARRHRFGQEQSGITLVEVLVSLLLLTVVSAAAFEFIQASMRAEVRARQRTTMVGYAREGLAVAADDAVSGTLSSRTITFGSYNVELIVGNPSTEGSADAIAWIMWPVKVEVRCPCDPTSMSNPVVLSGVVSNGP
jgi:type II secretory pathway pseudopilin PulG